MCDKSKLLITYTLNISKTVKKTLIVFVEFFVNNGEWSWS